MLNRIRINISDDPDHLIGDLLEFALSSDYINQVEEMFAPDGDGLLVPDIIDASRALEVMDLPEYMWASPPFDVFKSEIWVISRLRPGYAVRQALLEGDEIWRFVRVTTNPDIMAQQSLQLSKQAPQIL